MRATKACGCLIADNVIKSEIAKKKILLQITDLDKKIKKAKSKSAISKFKSEMEELSRAFRQVGAHREVMKKRFDRYIKESGYVPPKY